MSHQSQPGKAKRRIIIALVVIIAALCIALSAIGNYLVDYAVGRAGDGGNRQVSLNVEETPTAAEESEFDKNKAAQTALTKAFVETVEPEKISVKSDDGLNLTGFYYKNNSHQWALCIHGYRSSHLGMLNYVQRYHSAGYQVIAPDLRACGESEGSFVGMGWPDRFDMLKWIDWIIQQDSEAQIVLHGVSMGGATTMMTAGEETPDAVIAFVEDCGYTSVWDIFSSELKLRFGLPEFPVMNAASLVSNIRAHYAFDQASSLNQVKKCTKPMLFIHGTADDFVPFEMLQKLYDAKPGAKEMLIAEGAGHGLSATFLGDKYWNTVFAFIDNTKAQ